MNFDRKDVIAAVGCLLMLAGLYAWLGLAAVVTAIGAAIFFVAMMMAASSN